MEFKEYSHNRVMQDEIEKIANIQSENNEEEDFQEEYSDNFNERSTENEKEMTKKYDMESKIKRKVINEVIEQLQEMLYKGDDEDIRKRQVTSAKKSIKHARKRSHFEKTFEIF